MSSTSLSPTHILLIWRQIISTRPTRKIISLYDVSHGLDADTDPTPQQQAIFISHLNGPSNLVMVFAAINRAVSPLSLPMILHLNHLRKAWKPAAYMQAITGQALSTAARLAFRACCSRWDKVPRRSRIRKKRLTSPAGVKPRSIGRRCVLVYALESCLCCRCGMQNRAVVVDDNMLMA